MLDDQLQHHKKKLNSLKHLTSGRKENLERDKENLEKSKKDLEDSKTSTNTAEHNREIEKAENAMSRLREHAVNTKDRQDLQVPVQ